MIKIENLKVYNVLPAIKGIRNSYNSNNKSDSTLDKIGENDLKLIKSLIKKSSSHRKFTRQIFISMEITAPLYWWKQMDQYKVGTTTNSESTMHTLYNKEITLNDFSFDDKEVALRKRSLHNEEHQDWVCDLHTIVVLCEKYRKKYSETKNPIYFRRLIQILPESYNYKKTWTGSLENLIAMQERANHKIYEWDDFLTAIKKEEILNLLLSCFSEQEINKDKIKEDYKYIYKKLNENDERKNMNTMLREMISVVGE